MGERKAVKKRGCEKRGGGGKAGDPKDYDSHLLRKQQNNIHLRNQAIHRLQVWRHVHENKAIWWQSLLRTKALLNTFIEMTC